MALFGMEVEEKVVRIFDVSSIVMMGSPKDIYVAPKVHACT
jgi:hypothetical protein